MEKLRVEHLRTNSAKLRVHEKKPRVNTEKARMDSISPYKYTHKPTHTSTSPTINEEIFQVKLIYLHQYLTRLCTQYTISSHTISHIIAINFSPSCLELLTYNVLHLDVVK